MGSVGAHQPATTLKEERHMKKQNGIRVKSAVKAGGIIMINHNRRALAV
jgi:hypothetical protein